MIMNKRIIAMIISVIFCVFHKGYTQNTDSILTLKQCVDIAIANNLQIKQAELQSDVDHINLKQAKGNRLPQVVADLNHGLNQGRSIDPFTNTYNNQNITYGNYNLSGSIALFNGGQLKNT